MDAEVIDPQWIAGTVLGVPTLGVLLHKLLGVWSQDSKNRAGDDATKGTIEGLTLENERLRTHNTELVEWFMKSQNTIVRISNENQRLQIEIEQLRSNMKTVLERHAAVVKGV